MLWYNSSMLLSGGDISWAIDIIKKNHYTHSVPASTAYYFEYSGAIICYALPANKNIGKFLLWEGARVLELSRLWAGDGHENNLLTRGISLSLRELCKIRDIDAVVSYADPGMGHVGYVYQAASWLYCGQTERLRVYKKDGLTKPRRSFHSKGRQYTQEEIAGMGWCKHWVEGKHRYVKPVSRDAKRSKRLMALVRPYPKSTKLY